MFRDPAYWNALRRQLNPAEAEREFLALAPEGFLLAADPYEPIRRIQVWLDTPSSCADHYLYKKDHARSGQGAKNREDFLYDRAARIPWIPIALTEPDRIKSQHSRILPNGKTKRMFPNTFVYSCRTLRIGVEWEFFLVFVHRDGDSRHRFGTAMVATADYVERCSRRCWSDVKKEPR